MHTVRTTVLTAETSQNVPPVRVLKDRVAVAGRGSSGGGGQGPPRLGQMRRSERQELPVDAVECRVWPVGTLAIWTEESTWLRWVP